MATQSMYIDKDTFIPEKNYFKTEKVEVTRNLAKEEVEYQTKAIRWWSAGMWCVFGGLIIALIGCIVFGSYECWVGFGACAIVGIVMIFGGLKFCGDKNYEYNALNNKFYKENIDRLWQECAEFVAIQEYNEEQKTIAEAWRFEHPLEEKIRACLLDKNSSVDIAELARYYAEEYIKTKTN